MDQSEWHRLVSTLKSHGNNKVGSIVIIFGCVWMREAGQLNQFLVAELLYRLPHELPIYPNVPLTLIRAL